ncbi:SURF1 family protein [Prosthecomicrobium sp. N25]|uniref:SURF1 family protein n=1 Tax=Prosthecomicrobium sp. N25 TaxID=3129254 RepID=UPI003076C0FC
MTSPFRRLLWPTVATAIALAILAALGTWQLQRLAWKEALVARVAERTRLPPIPLPPEAVWSAVDGETNDYTPVTVEGRFLHDKEVHVFHSLSSPKGRLGGQGFFVMTPLQRPDGTVVIVNRGFVPLDRKDPKTRAEGQIPGETTVTGLLRRPEEPNAFTPADDPAKNVWFTRDAKRIAAAVGLDPARIFPLTLDAAAVPAPPGGLPQGGETTMAFPNNHLQYAVTWYGLALTLVGVYIAFARARLKADDPPEPPRPA